jgi:hypothetical protein
MVLKREELFLLLQLVFANEDTPKDRDMKNLLHATCVGSE